MREYIQDLVLLLCAGYRKSMGTIALKMDDMDEVYVLIDTAIPCGMIINELISNSFKYAFPDDRSGEIRIELTQTSDGEICLKMSDDGIGVAEGYDLRKQGGMGVKIAFALAESQLSGRMTLDCKKGIRFTLIFKDVFYKQRI